MLIASFKLWLGDFSKRPFVRNVATLASGSAIAQLVTLAVMPFVTRLFGPAEYGQFGQFIAIASAAATVAALAYPIAIVLPRSSIEANAVARLACYVAGTISTITALLIVVFGDEIASSLGAEDISTWLLLLPVFMFFSSLQEITRQWLARASMFRHSAFAHVSQAVFIGVSRLTVGLLAPFAGGLILIATAALGFHAFVMWYPVRHHLLRHRSRRRLRREIRLLRGVGHRYRSFPLLRAPQVLLSAISQSFPIVLLASLFSLSAAGYYALCRLALGAPASLLGSSVLQVFYPRFNHAVRTGENAQQYLIKTTIGLALLGALPFGAVALLGPGLFAWVFGSEWYVAGEFAQWLTLWYYCAFFNRAAVGAIPVLDRQGAFLTFEVLSVSAKFLALYLCYIQTEHALTAVAALSITSATLSLLLTLAVISATPSARSATPKPEGSLNAKS